MPKGKNQKLKLYHLAEIMIQYTDENNYLTMSQIKKYLEKYDVTADRKTIRKDFEDLESLGIVVEWHQEGQLTYYHVVSQIFELAEIKMLVDAVQSSKYISEGKTRELIGKLEKMVSIHEKKKLQRQITVAGRVKSMNESIFYNIDAIYNAIDSRKKIRFEYCVWNMKKELIPNRKSYCISPWGVAISNENLYLVGCNEQEAVRHFRIDKMRRIDISEESRIGEALFDDFNIAEYLKMQFEMYDGPKAQVKLRAENCMINVMIDRFGKDIFVKPDKENSNYFTFTTTVALSRFFYGWLMGVGDKVQLLGKQDDPAILGLKEEIRRMYDFYL